MRIIHLIDYFQTKIGYQEVFLAREHAKLGHEVSVVTSDRYYPFPAYKETFETMLGPRYVGEGRRQEDGIDVYRLKAYELSGSPVIYIKGMKNLFRGLSPQILFCHGMYSINSWQAAILKKKYGYKLIYDTHASSFNTDFSATTSKKLYHEIFKTVCIPVIKRNADQIFAVGDDEREFIIKDYGYEKEAVQLLRLGVDTARFSFSEKKRKHIRKRYNISNDDNVIIFSGKIAANKDVDILLKAIEKTGDRRIVGMIIGGGEKNYLDELKKIVKKMRVIWIPFVENTELPLYYSAAEIGVWPGNPTITLLEAMSCGVPVILPKIPATNYLQASKAVLYFERRDVQSLSERIQSLLADKKMLREKSKNASEYIKKHLSWDILARQSIKKFTDETK